MKITDNFIIINNKKIFFKLKKNVFEPNLTSKLLIESVTKNIKKKENLSLVDLGCGSGIVGLSVAKILKIKKKLFFSDLSKEAVSNTEENFTIFKTKGTIKQGSLFDPWSDYRFDIIINDISAISAEVSNISPWFKKIPCKSGRDGTDLSIKFLKDLPNHIKKNTKIFFPVLSLSNSQKIIDFAKKKFKLVKCVNEIKWPLPETMKNKKKKLKKLKKSKLINFQIISGKIICTTSIFMIKV